MLTHAKIIPPQDITYGLGYWSLQRNQKHPAAYYQDLLAHTLDLLTGSHLVVWYNDPDFAALIRPLAASRNITLSLRERALSDLPQWAASATALEACRAMALPPARRHLPNRLEKGTIHYWRDFTDSGAETCRALLAIWLSKVSLIYELSAENPFGTGWFGWADASLSRFSGTRSHWNFARRKLPAGKISHYGSVMRCHGVRLPLNASLLLGDSDAWAELQRRFEAALPEALSEPYAHDEETVISRFYHQKPQLFHRLGLPYVIMPVISEIYRVISRIKA